MRPLLAILTVMWLAVGMTSCSTRRNTAANRQYQAFITRYNIYFNGDEHFRETLEDMEKKHQDDYTALLPVHPVETQKQPGTAFDRSIEKARKAIQLRSIKKRPQGKAGRSRDPEYREWMKREEYNPFLHNAWMMLGRSQYFNADFATAASTFMYVAKHFRWLPSTVTEARLWQARCYCALGWLYEAEMILTRIPENELTDRSIAELYYSTWADMQIRSTDYAGAIPYLSKAVDYASGTQKQRLGYLLGQLYALEGQDVKAYEQFRTIARAGGASREMRLNARIRQSEVYQGTDVTSEIKSLRGMTRYSSNADYLDQLYYAIANLYMTAGDTVRAIDGYSEAITRSTRNGVDQAMARLALGKLYFDRGRYDLAQPCYAAAVTVIPDTYPGYDSIRHRSDVLDELAVYSRNVVMQDSLLRLADMSPAERLAEIEKTIERLKRAEKNEADAARRSEAEANMGAMQQLPTGNAAQAPSTFALNTDDSWYFYNRAVRDAGRSEFQRRWGNRRLEDDWRRSNKNSFATSDDTSDTDEGTGTDTDTAESPGIGTDDNETRRRKSDPHYPEYYLAQLPLDEVQRTKANEVIEGGLFNIAQILKDKLEDDQAAKASLLQLLRRYPDSQYRLEAYYALFMINLREGNEVEAERYRRLIVADFPESTYGEAMSSADYYRNLLDMRTAQDSLYRAAYAGYLADRNEDVHSALREMKDKYPMSELMPKFMFIDALAYVTDNDREQFGERLKELVERYPDADVSPVAASYISHLSKGRQLPDTPGNVRSMLRDTDLPSDSIESLVGEALSIELDPEAPQMLVLIYSTDSVSANELLFEVARHNFATFMTRDFDLETMKFGDLGILMIKGFTDQADLNRYRTLSQKAGFVLPRGVTPVMISEANFSRLLASGLTFDDYFKALERLSTERTHRDTLPDDQYPSQDEMYGDGDGNEDETELTQ